MGVNDSVLLIPLLQAVRGGHVLEEDGGGADVLGGSEAQDGAPPTDEPPWDARTPPAGEC